MHLKEENLTENHNTIVVSEIHTKLTINQWKKRKFVSWIAFCGKAKKKVETSSLRNLKALPKKPQRNCIFMYSISGIFVENLRVMS